MSRNALDLSTLRWRMGPAPRQAFDPPAAGSWLPADDRALVRTWHRARVPGAVRADLTAAGLAPRVERPDDIAAGDWANALDWWYEAELPGPFAADALVVLEADGIDDRCAVWLDDRLLAVHAGMFARQSIVLSPWINAPGPHTLAIRIWGATSLPGLPDSLWRRLVRFGIRLAGTNTEYFPDRMATPHAQYSFGWDFAPRVFGTGIWDDIRLVSCRGTYIEGVQVIPEPLAAGDPAPVRWRIRLALQLVGVPPQLAAVEITQEGGLCFEQTQPLPLASAMQPASSTFDVSGTSKICRVDPVLVTVETPPVRRWWPWDQGEPALCRIRVRLLDAGGGTLDEVSLHTGVRTVRRERLPDGSPWRFVINDRPVFLRGANWTPADVLPGTVTAEDYMRLLRMAKEAGINFLRVWGGGVRERTAFWQECDRLGITAWQEFPLACAFLDHHPRTPAYISALADEARGIVRSLRNRPSLLAWCGGNEINPGRERLPLAAIARVLAEEDPERPWIVASPSDDDVHQWDVWHGYAPWTELQEQDPPFMSEFGMQALPDPATIAEMFPTGAPRSLTDEPWAARKAQANKLRHYTGMAADKELVTAIELTQRVQAAALQTGIEACRIRREGSDATDRRTCGGVAFWQFNEPWRAVSWSVVDRAGRPKAAYAMLQRSYRPLLIAARFARRPYSAGDIFEADIWLVNDLPTSFPRGGESASLPRGEVPCRAEAFLDEQRVWTMEVDYPATGAHRLAALRVALPAAPGALILRLLDGDAVLADNRYDLRLPLPGPRPAARRLLRCLADRLLQA